MIYEYSCEKCQKSVDVVKPLADYDRVEMCPTCSDTKMIRAFAPTRTHLYGTKVEEAYFSHALGQVVKGDTHARQIAKQKGLIELGNENPHKHLKPKLHSYDD